MRVAADRVSRTSEVEAKLKWLIEQEGPALLEVITDRKVPVLPMVPSGRGLHEFLVYDESESCQRTNPADKGITTDSVLAKEKERKDLMRQRNVDFKVNHRD